MLLGIVAVHLKESELKNYKVQSWNLAGQEQLVGRQQKVLYLQDMTMLYQIEIWPICKWAKQMLFQNT